MDNVGIIGIDISKRLRLLLAGATDAGRNSHPLRDGAFPRHTVSGQERSPLRLERSGAQYCRRGIFASGLIWRPRCRGFNFHTRLRICWYVRRIAEIPTSPLGRKHCELNRQSDKVAFRNGLSGSGLGAERMVRPSGDCNPLGSGRYAWRSLCADCAALDPRRQSGWFRHRTDAGGIARPRLTQPPRTRVRKVRSLAVSRD